MNGPAIWWVLAALNGFMPHEPRRRLTLGPVLPPGRKRACYPAISPRYWAEVAAEETPAERVLRFVPRRFFRGDGVELRELRLRGAYDPVSVTVCGEEVPGRPRPAGVYTDFIFDGPVRLAADDVLEIAV
jgi:hypothetical protein